MEVSIKITYTIRTLNIQAAINLQIKNL